MVKRRRRVQSHSVSASAARDKIPIAPEPFRPTMEHIRAIQEIVDTNKGDIPTGVVMDLMKECQSAHTKQSPELYRLTWIKVDSTAHVIVDSYDDHVEPIASVKLLHATQTIIVEAVDHLDSVMPFIRWPGGLPDAGIMLKRWLDAPKPIVIGSEKEKLRIIISIEPFVPKRPRSEEDSNFE